MKKIMISILATITITTAIATILINQKNVLAQEENERLKFNENQEVNKKEIWELNIDSEGTEYLKSNNNEEIREAWRYDDEGNLISVPMSEYLSILNSTVNTGDLGIASNEYIESREEKHVKENKSPNEIWKYRYTQTSKSYPYGSAIKVIPSVNGGANGFADGVFSLKLQ